MARREPGPAQKALWRLEAVFYDAFCWTMRRFPIDLASSLGGRLFRAIGPLTEAHKTARANLELAFPQASSAEIKGLLGDQWENNGRLAAEFPLMDKITPASGRVTVVGRERFVEIAANGEPVVFVSGHLSNFEVMASAIMDGGVTCLVTYRATNNPYIDQRIREGRRAYGVRLFAPKGESARELIEALKGGETIAIMNDQKFNTGPSVSFFGHPAHTAPGPTRLALGAGAALQPLSVRRGRGARFTVTVHEPIPLKREGDRTANILDGVAKITEFIEQRIRERPEEWFWVHRRWPNEVYVEHEAAKEKVPGRGARRRRRGGLGWGVAAVLAVLILALSWREWGDDIRSFNLDPRQPFQVMTPPPAPDYDQPGAWALLPSDPSTPSGRPVDVFFVGPTTYDGGRTWNDAYDDPKARRLLERTMLPNYAGPFSAVGRLFVPLYRQASLYSMLRSTTRDDARDARRLAYDDIRRSFQVYINKYNFNRPFILVGVEQGGSILDRLMDDSFTADPNLRRRLVAAYLIETVTPAGQHAPGTAAPACRAAAEAGCVLAWKSSRSPLDLSSELGRAMVWEAGDKIGLLSDMPPALCVNPLLGAVGETSAGPNLSLGAANAVGLALSTPPKLIAHAVSARCDKGLLRVSGPLNQGLRASGGWADRLKAAPYNLFYGDIQADAKRRAATLLGMTKYPDFLPPITDVRDVAVPQRQAID